MPVTHRAPPKGHARMTPPALPRGSEFVARAGVVSWLRVASPAFPTARSVAKWARALARYSGGAAPASHRFPWPLLARSIVCDANRTVRVAGSNLRAARTAGKRVSEPFLEHAALGLVHDASRVDLRRLALEPLVELGDRADEDL